MCVYIKIAPHCRLSIECLEIKNKCRQRNSKYDVKSFKQVKIEKYITPLAGSILTNRSRVWPVNFFINTSKVSGSQRIVNTAAKCHISAEISLDYFIPAVWGGNEKLAELRAGSLYSCFLTRLRSAASLRYLIFALCRSRVCLQMWAGSQAKVLLYYFTVDSRDTVYALCQHVIYVSLPEI